MELDARALAAELHNAVEGEVRFGAGTRALYTTGGSNYRQVPIGVVIPKTIDDVVATVEVSRAHGAPILSRGGGTSLAGQISNVAVVLDFSKYLNNVLEIDPERNVARVEPGTILDHLRHQAEAKHQLTLRVGEGTISIREDGKILIKGTDLVSHAQRMNRIKGGAVSIN